MFFWVRSLVNSLAGGDLDTAESDLGLVPSQHVDHDLHDRLVHAQHPHQVRVLVEHLVVHDVTGNTHTDTNYIMSTAIAFIETNSGSKRRKGFYLFFEFGLITAR